MLQHNQVLLHDAIILMPWRDLVGVCLAHLNNRLLHCDCNSIWLPFVSYIFDHLPRLSQTKEFYRKGTFDYQLYCFGYHIEVHKHIHTTFPQHVWYLLPEFSEGIRRKQIGQSSSCGGGCLKSSSSCSLFSLSILLRAMGRSAYHQNQI